MLTFGIAGHVDHGKTSLVHALTGMQTDRLPEEQRRGISIELGFAWLDVKLADNTAQRIALVDMPGHERFVRRMIAGAAGVDAMLMVIAADEGVMPQGREHLAICQLLGIERGAVILTKTDLVDDFMLEMAREDVKELVANTFLQDAPVWPFSARSAAGAVAVREGLVELAQQIRQQSQSNARSQRPFRMWIDRSFVVQGRGTVVAGTATSGTLKLEDQLQIWPSAREFRVRALHQQGQNLPQIQAPGRTAINLAAATLEDAPIGSLVATPGTAQLSDRVDVLLHLLQFADALPVRRRAMLHVGTAQTEGWLTQLSGNDLQPGETAAVQLQFDRPLALVAGDGIIVRGSQVNDRYGQTLAGGRVLHPRARRHKIGDAAVLAALADLAQPRIDMQVLALVELAGVRGETDASVESLLDADPAIVQRALKSLLAAGKLRKVGTPQRYLSGAAVGQLERQIVKLVAEFHVTNPTRRGMDGETVPRALGSWLDPTSIGHLVGGLVKKQALVQSGSLVHLPDFAPQILAEPAQIAAFAAALAPHGLACPLLTQLLETLAMDPRQLGVVAQAAVQLGEVVRYAEDLWALKADVDAAVDGVVGAFAGEEIFTTAQLKDLLGLTRKHLIPFAEYLDAQRITVRDPSGNRRIRANALKSRIYSG